MITGMRTSGKLLLTLLLISFAWSARAQQSIWPALKKEMKPWTRWWWMGSAVNEKSLAASLSLYQQVGFGGLEIAPIYGAMGYEPQYVDYLSPRWMELLRYTVATAGDLEMGIDLTNGTGWPFGGPQVTKPYAASRMIIQRYNVKTGEPFNQRIRINDAKQDGATLQAVTAYNGDKVVSLKDKVDADGVLHWSPPSGDWELYALFNGNTLQTVKRAAPGGEGYTLDHLSAEALPVYLNRFDKAFEQRSPGVRAYYNDSYEVYGADWTKEFPAAFERKRGYDITKYLRELTGKDTTAKVARLKSDYRETMSELLLENFTRPWTQWTHKYQGITKNQAHGSPGNLLDLYAAVDIPECETFGSTYFPIPGLRRDSADIRNVDPDPVMLKFASSAAHVAGHPLVSCETFTWLTEHFKTSLSQCKPEVEQCFLAGVNHVFYHGTTFSPAEVPWPGWLFYASVNFVPDNSFWSHLPALNQYITRVQSVLQTGVPDNELLIYWPVYDAWNTAKGKDMPLKVHDIDEWLHPTPFYKQVTALQKAGYSLDFVSDGLLAKATADNKGILTNNQSAAYKILIVPRAELMPVTTLQQMIKLAGEGATVLLEALPQDVPGLGTLESRRKQLKTLLASLKFVTNKDGIQRMKVGKGKLLLCPDIQKALQANGIERESLTDAGLKFIRRKNGNNHYYYLVNHTPQTINQFIPLNEIKGTAVLMDPQTGITGKGLTEKAGSSTRVKLQLQPGEAMIVKGLDDATVMVDWKYLEAPGSPVAVTGKWQLEFRNGGPAIPASRTLDQLVSWTALQDTAANAYSGTGIYTIAFNLPEKTAGEYLLDLGEVHESAHVWVNGQDAGIFWAIPFKGRIGEYLQQGRNEIKIEVANLMANRIRYMDQHKIPWRRYHEINFVNINYKDFNAADWTLQPSGLIGPVSITPYR